MGQHSNSTQHRKRCLAQWKLSSLCWPSQPNIYVMQHYQQFYLLSIVIVKRYHLHSFFQVSHSFFYSNVILSSTFIFLRFLSFLTYSYSISMCKVVLSPSSSQETSTLTSCKTSRKRMTVTTRGGDRPTSKLVDRPTKIRLINHFPLVDRLLDVGRSTNGYVVDRPTDNFVNQ